MKTWKFTEEQVASGLYVPFTVPAWDKTSCSW
jgi:hypothetical protein